MHKDNGFAEVNGTRLYYEVAGSGDPLVLIHGSTLDTRMWDDQFETFAQYYQVIRYDVRGFGKSALPTDESYTRADDLRALLEYLGIPHANVLGLSMGGRIAISFALLYPDMTRSLIIVDSFPEGFQPPPEPAGLWSALFAKAKDVGTQAAKRLWLDNPLFEPAREKPHVASCLALIISDYSGWHWINKDPKQAISPPAIQRLGEVAAPTLIIVGERDLRRFHTIADTMQQQIANAQKVVLPGVGHIPNMEDADRFNQNVLSFLRGLEITQTEGLRRNSGTTTLPRQ